MRQTSAGALVLSHDSPESAETELTLDEALSFLAGTDLELLVEVKLAEIAQKCSTACTSLSWRTGRSCFEWLRRQGVSAAVVGMDARPALSGT